MAKTVQSDSVNQYIAGMRESLAASNITDTASIDKLLAKQGLESILTNNNLLQYFKIANAGYHALTTSFPLGGASGSKSLSAAPPDPSDYQFYWSKEHDTHRGVPGLDFIPREYLFNPDALAQWAGFNEREHMAVKQMMRRDGPAPGEPQQAQSAPPPPSGGAGAQSQSYGGSSGGGGSGSKALGTHGGSGAKSLGAPPPPPGMGGGGYGGGYGGEYGGGYGGGGGSMTQGMNFFPQNEWNWAQNNVNGMVGADWLQPLFAQNGRYREVTANAIEQMNSIDQFMMQIRTQFANVDPASPEGQRQMFLLTQQMQDLGGKKQEIMDKVIRMQNLNDEMMNGLKTLQQKVFDDVNAIIRNIGK